MILADTTVLAYAVGAAHPLREPCRELIARVRDGRLRASTTTEVVQEFVHVRSRRRDRGDAVALGRAYATLFAPLTQPDRDDLDEGLAVFAEHTALGAFDAVLAAAARRRGAAVVSADRGFDGVADLVRVDPGDPDFARTLAALGH